MSIHPRAPFVFNRSGAGMSRGEEVCRGDGHDEERRQRLPEPFKDPRQALTMFRRSLPGETGLRNQLRGDGYFSIDFSLSKSWTMPWASGHKLRFRWDTFNLTNTPSFDVFFMDMFPDREASFGRYYNTIQTCDGGAGRCMQFALRYEF
jgi:hypothetical protein